MQSTRHTCNLWWEAANCWLCSEPQTLPNHIPVPVGDSSLFVDLHLSLSRPAFPTAVKNTCHLDLLNFWILLHGAVSLKIRYMESFTFNLQEKNMSPHHWLQTQIQAGTFSCKRNILFSDFLTLSKLSGPAVHCLRPLLAGRVIPAEWDKQTICQPRPHLGNGTSQVVTLLVSCSEKAHSPDLDTLLGISGFIARRYSLEAPIIFRVGNCLWYPVWADPISFPCANQQREKPWGHNFLIRPATYSQAFKLKREPSNLAHGLDFAP